MKTTQKKIFLLFILSGALLALSFPPLPFPLLAFAALVPLLFAFELDVKPKRPLLYTYVTFFIYHYASNWWISSFQAQTDPFLMASGFAVALVHPFFFMVPVGAHIFLRNKFGSSTALWLFPFIWLAFEWLHSLGDLAYPWLTVGYTQIYNSLWIQIADLQGVWGASFLIVLINVLILKIILLARHARKLSNTKKFYDLPGVKSKIAAIFLLFLIPVSYGVSRKMQFNHDRMLKVNPVIEVGIIQANMNPWVKWSSGAMDQIRLHQDMQDSLESSAGSLDLAIWSETAIPFVSWDFNEKHRLNFLTDRIDPENTSLLTGFSNFYIYAANDDIPKTAKYMPYDSSQRFDTFNAALMLNPKPYDSLNPQFYHKQRLTPMAERLPYAEIFYFAKSWFEWGVGISGWQKGRDQHNLVMIKDSIRAKVGTIICIESIYPGFCRNFTARGANMLSVITNDAWYDHTPGPEQHYQIAAMRAIENRRYIARCANTGVSGIITPLGNSSLRAPEYKRVGIRGQVPLMEGKSFYVRTGDWLAMLSTLVSAFAIFYGFILKFTRKNTANFSK